MGTWQRFKLIFKSKANAAMDKAENPAQTLDYSYEKQLEMLQKVRRGVADVATSRKRVELQIAGLDKQLGTLDNQARAALAGGREDLAREALTRKSAVTTQIADLHVQLDQLHGAGAEADGRLAAAAEQGRGLPHAEGDHQGHLLGGRGAGPHQRGVHRHLQRARRRRPGDPAGRGPHRRRCRPGPAPWRSSWPPVRSRCTGGKDSLTAELERMASDNQVENELAAMRAQLGGGEPPPAAVTGAAPQPCGAHASNAGESGSDRAADQRVDASTRVGPTAPPQPTPAPSTRRSDR